jgi:hypothetical protein
MFAPARARLNLNRKDRVKTELAANIVYHSGEEEERGLSIGYIPGAMMIPSFSTAAILAGADWQKPTSFDVMQSVIDDNRRLRDPLIHQISVTLTCNFLSFARMLSKIALGIAHYRLGPDAFEPIAREFIRFGNVHPNHFVGGFADRHGAPYPPPGTIHCISLWHHENYLVVTIQLFGTIDESPVNYAVVGTLPELPPGLPPLHLGGPAQRLDRSPGPLETGDPNTVIQWDQKIP